MDLSLDGGPAVTWVGAMLGWDWVRNLWFRASQLAAILFVVGESLAGVWRPLTVREDALRGAREEKGFVARWVRRILVYDFPEWMFTTAYVLFALMLIATLVWLPPRRRQ